MQNKARQGIRGFLNPSIWVLIEVDERSIRVRGVSFEGTWSLTSHPGSRLGFSRQRAEEESAAKVSDPSVVMIFLLDLWGCSGFQLTKSRKREGRSWRFPDLQTARVFWVQTFGDGREGRIRLGFSFVASRWLSGEGVECLLYGGEN
jgi:hypothetical protein